MESFCMAEMKKWLILKQPIYVRIWVYKWPYQILVTRIIIWEWTGIDFYFFFWYSPGYSLYRTEQIEKSSIKAILETVYNSYWIRIRKTNNDDVSYRTDDNFDKSLSYENWADFQTDEDDRKWSSIWMSHVLWAIIYES